MHLEKPSKMINAFEYLLVCCVSGRKVKNNILAFCLSFVDYGLLVIQYSRFTHKSREFIYD